MNDTADWIEVIASVIRLFAALVSARIDAARGRTRRPRPARRRR